MEVWEPLLPAAALQYIMESLVLPRVRLAVQAWDPLRDPVALHTWVHPWLVRLARAAAAAGPRCRRRCVLLCAFWGLAACVQVHAGWQAAAWQLQRWPLGVAASMGSGWPSVMSTL